MKKFEELTTAEKIERLQSQCEAYEKACESYMEKQIEQYNIIQFQKKELEKLGYYKTHRAFSIKLENKEGCELN